MNNFMDKWFGPLPREYCVYFYALSIVFGIMWVVSLVAIITFVMLHFKKISLTFIINSCMMLLNIALAYLANRLLHTMCVKTV